MLGPVGLDGRGDLELYCDEKRLILVRLLFLLACLMDINASVEIVFS